jgi:hypothetical protein
VAACVRGGEKKEKSMRRAKMNMPMPLDLMKWREICQNARHGLFARHKQSRNNVTFFFFFRKSSETSLVSRRVEIS